MAIKEEALPQLKSLFDRRLEENRKIRSIYAKHAVNESRRVVKESFRIDMDDDKEGRFNFSDPLFGLPQEMGGCGGFKALRETCKRLGARESSGPSRSAKTPIAQRVSVQLGGVHISASDWVRQRYAPDFHVVTIADRQRAIEEMTKLSQELLLENPDHCVNHIIQKYPGVLDDPGLFVLEGLRNPRDFSRLIRPNKDMVFILSMIGSPLSPMTFETEGLAIIEQTINWFAKCGMMPADHIMKSCIVYFSEVDTFAETLSKWVKL